MTRRGAALALCLPAVGAVALAGAPAGAQLQLGGSVPDLIALAIDPPATGFHRLAGGSVYELRVPVRITSSVDETHLSISDGQDFSGPARGHLRDGSHLVGSPLEAAVPGRPAQPLNGPVDPLLETWLQTLAQAPVTIAIRQALPRGSIAAPGLHKTLLITVSSQTP